MHEIEIENDTFYFNGDLYSGIVVKYDLGKLKFKSEIKDGVEDGFIYLIDTFPYDTNGVTAWGKTVFEGQTVDGKIIGRSRAYYSTGEMMFDLDVARGKLNGRSFTYDKDGVVIQIVDYKDDLVHGLLFDKTDSLYISLRRYGNILSPNNFATVFIDIYNYMPDTSFYYISGDSVYYQIKINDSVPDIIDENQIKQNDINLCELLNNVLFPDFVNDTVFYALNDNNDTIYKATYQQRQEPLFERVPLNCN